MTANATSRQEPDASNPDRTLDSWDDLIYGDTVRYVGENHTNLGLDGVLTFLHVSMYETTVTFGDRFNGRRPLAVKDWPAEDFERVTEDGDDQ